MQKSSLRQRRCGGLVPLDLEQIEGEKGSVFQSCEDFYSGLQIVPLDIIRCELNGIRIDILLVNYEAWRKVVINLIRTYSRVEACIREEDKYKMPQHHLGIRRMHEEGATYHSLLSTLISRDRGYHIKRDVWESCRGGLESTTRNSIDQEPSNQSLSK